MKANEKIEGLVLSDTQIRERLGKDLLIHPMLSPDRQIAGCKIDLHLGCNFYEVKHSSLSAYDPLSAVNKPYIRTLILRPGETYVLHPRELVMVPAFENISLPHDILGILQGRTSLARLGVIVHATAGFLDPGYCGATILELSNLGHLPVEVSPMLNVASVAFLRIGGTVEWWYGRTTRDIITGTRRVGRHDRPGFVPSKLHEDWESKVLSEIKRDSQAKAVSAAS